MLLDHDADEGHHEEWLYQEFSHHEKVSSQMLHTHEEEYKRLYRHYQPQQHIPDIESHQEVASRACRRSDLSLDVLLMKVSYPLLHIYPILRKKTAESLVRRMNYEFVGNPHLISINTFMANKAYTIRLNPSIEQEQQLRQTAGAARWLWNQSLDMTKQAHKETGKFLFQFDLNKRIPELRKQNEWLKQINSQVLQQKNRDLDTALKRSFKTHGFPKFKCKHKNNDSFRVPQHFKLSNKGVKLPKIGWVKWKPNRKLKGKAKSVTIKQDLDKWVAVVLCEIPNIPTRNSFAESEVVGIDVGIKDFAVLSSGEKISNPNHLAKSEKLLKYKQRKLSKKVKGSNNRIKARKQLAKLHRHISNQRKDFQWKQVAEITNQFSVVCMEDLNIKGMKRNHKLAKSISNAGWFNFKTKLKHKLAEQGGLLVNIDRFAPSTKMCGSCGALNDNLTLKDREWDCDCGAHHDRDINAAINIRLFGLSELNRLGTSRIYACGETADGELTNISSSYVSLKQENLVVGPEAAVSLERR